MNLLVSCIIPVYNGERFLHETLESVAAQTHPIHEIVLVDDGSTDGTRASVEAYATHATMPIRYLWQENAGPSSARNRGIQQAVGEFLTFIDADDLWHPEKTALQLARFAARPELEISVGHVQNFWMDEVRDEAERLRDHARAQPVAGYLVTTLMARRTLFTKIGFLDTSLKQADSAEWFMRASKAKVIDELLPDVLMQRRLHLNNISRTNAKDSRLEFLHLMHRMRS